jgi:two-component system LytT family sensor kinase
MSLMRWRKFAAIVGPWTLFGLYSGAETHYRSSFGRMPYSWWHSLTAETAYTILWAPLTPLAMRLARRFRIERGRVWRNFSIHMIAAVLCSVLTKTIWDFIESAGPGPAATFYWRRYFLSMSTVFTEGISLYWLIVLFTYAYDYYRQYHESLIKASALQTQLVQAQLQALKMQLHPHFLFNALHSISALVHEDAEGADRMIARLSDLLRLSLETGGAQQVPLHQELHFLNLYLEIEKTRFEERLEVIFDIDPVTGDAYVPNMLFQPLVENSIRHGLAPKVRGGQIRIGANRDGNKLVLRVIDNGQGLAEDGVTGARQGIGLFATRGRLERLYGNEQSLLLRNVRGGGAEALIVIPFTTDLGVLNDANKHPDSG